MVAQMNYLTVQDHLWIHLRVTKKKEHFSFSKLEEAVHYQYGYGHQPNFLRQASNYVVGFSKKQPFASANTATAFVGLMMFLELNGRQISINPANAAQWFGDLKSDPVAALGVLEESAVEGEHHHDSPEIVGQRILNRYSSAIKTLAEQFP